MKYLLMGTSSNFGNMFSMAAAVLFLPFLIGRLIGSP
jgi:Mg2+-importing ATPase